MGSAHGLFDQVIGQYYYLFRGLSMGVIMLVVMIATAVVLVLALVYYAMLLRMTSVTRNSLRAGRRIGRISVYPAVINIILAAFSAIGMFGMLASFSGIRRGFPSGAYGRVVGLSTFSSILSLAQLILAAVLIIQFAGRVNRTR